MAIIPGETGYGQGGGAHEPAGGATRHAAGTGGRTNRLFEDLPSDPVSAQFEKGILLGREADDAASALVEAEMAADVDAKGPVGAFKPVSITIPEDEPESVAALRNALVERVTGSELKQRAGVEFDFHRERKRLAQASPRLSAEWDQRATRLDGQLDFYANKAVGADGDEFNRLVDAASSRLDAMDTWYRPGQKEKRVASFMDTVQYARARRHIEASDGEGFAADNYHGLGEGRAEELQEYAGKVAFDAGVSRALGVLEEQHTDRDGTMDWDGAAAQLGKANGPQGLGIGADQASRVLTTLAIRRRNWERMEEARREKGRLQDLSELFKAYDAGDMDGALGLVAEGEFFEDDERARLRGAFAQKEWKSSPRTLFRHMQGLVTGTIHPSDVLSGIGSGLSRADGQNLMKFHEQADAIWLAGAKSTLLRTMDRLVPTWREDPDYGLGLGRKRGKKGGARQGTLSPQWLYPDVGDPARKGDTARETANPDDMFARRDQVPLQDEQEADSSRQLSEPMSLLADSLSLLATLWVTSLYTKKNPLEVMLNKDAAGIIDPVMNLFNAGMGALKDAGRSDEAGGGETLVKTKTTTSGGDLEGGAQGIATSVMNAPKEASSSSDDSQSVSVFSDSEEQFGGEREE